MNFESIALAINNRNPKIKINLNHRTRDGFEHLSLEGAAFNFDFKFDADTHGAVVPTFSEMIEHLSSIGITVTE